MHWQTLAYKPLYRLLAEHLEARIRAGDFPPGAYLPPVRRLMELFDVSLATVRGALETLETEGLITRRQGAGVVVTAKGASSGAAPSEKPAELGPDVRELFDLRAVLEPAALEAGFDSLDRDRLRGTRAQAASFSRADLYRLDQALHDEIARRCPNRHLRRALDDVMTRIELYRKLKFRHIDTDRRDFACVSGIIKAILAGDRARAAVRLREHIEATRDTLLKKMRPRPSGLEEGRFRSG